MNVVIIADLHLGRSHKLNPKLTEITLKAFKQVRDTIPWDVMLIAGDLFETGTPHPSLIAEFMALLHDTKNKPILLNYGNHDATRKGSATDPLKAMNLSHVTVVTDPGVYEVGGLRVLTENWPNDMNSKRGMTKAVNSSEPFDCVMLHGSAKDHPNAPRDSWYYYADTDKPKFFGHLHTPSMDPTGMYPGTLVPGSFNEAHEAGGILWRRGGEGTIERFTLPGYPRFRTVEEGIALTTQVKENEHVRVVAKSGRNLNLERSVRARFESVTVDYKPPENLIRAEAAAISKAKTMLETYRAYLEGTRKDTSILESAKEFLHA